MDLTISPVTISQRALEILISPHRVWEKIKTEERSWQQILLTYFIPLTIFSFLIRFIELAIIGVPTVVGRITTSFIAALFFCTASALLTPLFAILLGRGAILITDKVKQPASFERTSQLILYAFTPLFFIPLLSFLPFYQELSSIGMLYAVYLAAYGSGPLLGLNRENQILFGIGILGISILLSIALAFLFHPMMPQPTL